MKDSKRLDGLFYTLSREKNPLKITLKTYSDNKSENATKAEFFYPEDFMFSSYDNQLVEAGL